MSRHIIRKEGNYVILTLLLRLTLLCPIDYVWCDWKYGLIRPKWETFAQNDYWSVVLAVLEGAPMKKRGETTPLSFHFWIEIDFMQSAPLDKEFENKSKKRKGDKEEQ